MNQSASRKIFLNLFPPPRFLEMPAVGLDLSDEVVRFVELKKAGSHYEIGDFGQKSIPADVLEEGYIKDKEGLIKILTSLRLEHKLQYIKASLPEDKAYLFTTQIPVMDEADIHSALQYKIEENVPISLKDAVFDYRIITAAKDHIDLSVTVIHTKVVSSYLEVFRASGLIPLEIQLESQAISRIAFTPGETDAAIVVAIRETKTVVAIVSRGVVQFTSTIPVSSKSITEAIQKNFFVNLEEAHNIRLGKEKKESNEMLASIMNTASVIQDEIKKLFTYWEGHSEAGNQIKKIILSGSDTLLGIDDYLSRSIDLPITIIDPWRNITSLDRYMPPMTHRESLDYVPALGLALPNNSSVQ